jgi:hypothetical protein
MQILSRKQKNYETITLLTGLFWYEKELPLVYVIKQCAKRFGTLSDGLYVVANALNDGILVQTANATLSLALK